MNKRAKMGNKKVHFNPDYNVIMWISTKGGLPRKDEGIIIKIIRRKLRKKLIFIGHCFGRYDLIAEFKAGSGKVVSNTVCELQEKLGEELRTRVKKIVDPLCSSLTLANKVMCRSLPITSDTGFPPIKTYTFLQPKKRINLGEIVLKLDSTMELSWITSSYAFLLSVRGSNFSEMFNKVINFREGTRRHFRESCTYVGLDFWKSDVRMAEPVRALVFLKLRKGFGDFKLDKQKNEYNDWHPPEKRLGWSDICLTPKNKYTLRELKDAILKLRENHRNKLITTSTLLLPNEG